MFNEDEYGEKEEDHVREEETAVAQGTRIGAPGARNSARKPAQRNLLGSAERQGSVVSLARMRFAPSPAREPLPPINLLRFS